MKYVYLNVDSITPNEFIHQSNILTVQNISFNPQKYTSIYQCTIFFSNLCINCFDISFKKVLNVKDIKLEHGRLYRGIHT